MKNAEIIRILNENAAEVEQMPYIDEETAIRTEELLEAIDGAVKHLSISKRERMREFLSDILDFTGKLALILFLTASSGAMILGVVKLLLWVFDGIVG